MISNIHIPDNVLAATSAKDIFNFLNHVTTNPNYQKTYASMSVCDRTVIDDSKNKLMTTVKIRFQMWKPKENGTGTTFEWICNRAKDHSCSNTHIEELAKEPVIELEKA